MTGLLGEMEVWMTKAVPAPTRMSCDDPATNDQVSQARQAELNAALQKYLDLMYDCDRRASIRSSGPRRSSMAFATARCKSGRWTSIGTCLTVASRRNPRMPRARIKSSLWTLPLRPWRSSDRGLGVCRLPDLAL